MATLPLLPEPKRLWVEALRSEEYGQAKGALRTEDGYCCLGVLCEVAIKAGVKVKVEGPNDDGHHLFDGYEDFPPPSVCEWAFGTNDVPLSVRIDDSFVDDSYMEAELADLNDSKDWTFEQIADAIDESL